jgi:hypothetical protein
MRESGGKGDRRNDGKGSKERQGGGRFNERMEEGCELKMKEDAPAFL